MSFKSLSIAGAALLALSGTSQAVTNGFANGGFENVGTTTPAASWLQAASGYTRSTDARTGSFSAQLSSPLFNAAVMLQNSVDQGNLPPLTVGDVPAFSFWAKGTAGPSGNALFALRYLDGTGNILANSGNQFFHTLINPTAWTKITYTILGGVPVGATAAFVEFSQGKGDLGPLGVVLVDDVILGVVPEPGTYALLLAGLAVVGVMAKRRRAA